VMIGVIKKNN